MDGEDSKIVKDFVGRFEKAAAQKESVVMTMQEIMKLQTLSEKRQLSDWELDAWNTAWCELENAVF